MLPFCFPIGSNWRFVGPLRDQHHHSATHSMIPGKSFSPTHLLIGNGNRERCLTDSFINCCRPREVGAPEC